MPTPNDMEALASRTGQLIDSICDAILTSAQVAAEKIELAATVARIRQRMAAFGAVLEAVGEQKRVLVERLAEAAGPTKALIEQQIALLTEQEVAVLTKAGVSEPTAVAALAAAEVTPSDGSPPAYRREGRRFVRTGRCAGPRSNGTPGGPGEEGGCHEE
jgi:hypothetical protein